MTMISAAAQLDAYLEQFDREQLVSGRDAQRRGPKAETEQLVVAETSSGWGDVDIFLEKLCLDQNRRKYRTRYS